MFFFKGLLIGFSIAAPVGPIGVLCIRRTISDGRLVGFLSGLGAATADAFYGAIAAFGLTAISILLIKYHFWIQTIGGIFLLYLGIKTLTLKPTPENVEVKKSHIGFFSSTFFLTITNPMTILSFIAVFAGLGLANAKYNFTASALTVLGVFLGSALWWFILSGGINLLKNKFNTNGLRIVNILAGLIIIGFAIFALIK
jgi:threonine/homoserine/homoserine lactone efflux protein